MRLEKASSKAIRYACMNFHYAKAIPNVSCAYSVFNDKNEWCGVICYGVGVTNNIGKPFGLSNGQCIELLRVALNGKHGITSKALSISLKLIKNDAPLVKMIVSYADSEQGHSGTIYQATQWFYVGDSTDANIIVNGKREHRRTLNSRYGTNSVSGLLKMGVSVQGIIKTKPKRKYIYPLHKSIVPLCKKLAKPYPKKQQAAEALMDDATGNPAGEGVRFDPAAQKK